MDPHRNLGLVAGLRQLREDAGGGSPEVVVAVIDGPVDINHPVFAGARVRALGADSGVLGAEDQLARHGTHVASILFGQPGTSVEGICPNVTGIFITVYDERTGRAPQLEIARAIDRAIAEGAQIINFSGGQYSDSGTADQWLQQAVARCEEAGVLLIAAAGNDGCDCLHVPAASPSVLAVGACDDDGAPLDFSNYGHLYATSGIVAPGQDVLGALPGAGTTQDSGTSLAAPIVTGVAALLLSRDPGRTPLQIREILLRGVEQCDSNVHEYCRRLLAGHLSIEGALTHMNDIGSAMEASGAAPSCGCGGSMPVPQASAAGASPSMADAPDAGGLVYALGTISYDFGTEARRDSFKQLMPPVEVDGIVVPPNPYDARQMVAYLADRPYEARALIWTLNIELTPVYALEPAGAFAAILYEKFVEMLAGEVLAESDEDHIQRVSIPGRLTDRHSRLFSGQVVPVLQGENLRGAYGWKTNALVSQAAAAVGGRKGSKSDAASISENLRGFLDRVYYDLRNLGVLSSDRALNFAATNAFQAAAVFSEALGAGMQLESVETERSPFARADADAWDVKLKFFDPENTRRARRVYRFTVDVSDTMPVTLGEVRSWTAAN